MFKVRENWDSSYQIISDDFLFSTNNMEVNGSYGVIQARLLGFTYANFLRFCRANYNGVLRGREGYSYCVFKNKNDAVRLCGLLNQEFSKVKEIIK